MFQSFKFQVCLLVQKGPKFHNIMVPIIKCQLYSRVRPSINIKDKVCGKQFLFVTILQACMQMSAFSFVACEKVEKRNLSACNKGKTESRLPWVAMVGKIQRIKDNIPIIYISSFRHFLVKNKLFIESFHYKVISYNFLLIFS